MIKNLKMLFKIFSSKDKYKLIIVFLGILFTGFWDIIGIGSIMPFISLASNPSLLEANKYLRFLYSYFNFKSVDDFLFVFGIVVASLLIISNLFRALVDYVIKRFAAIRQHDISLTLFKKYIYQEYDYFLYHNSSELTKNILNEVWILINNILIPTLEMLSRAIISAIIIIFLTILNPIISALISISMISIYLLIYMTARKQMNIISENRLQLNSYRFKIVTEAFGGIKDVKLLGSEDYIINIFKKPSFKYAKLTYRSDILSDLPKFALEALAFSSIILIIIYLIKIKGEFNQIIPLVGAYSFSAYRLMPSLQLAFRGMVKIKANVSVIELLFNLIYENNIETYMPKYNNIKMKFNKKLELRNIEYSYPKAKRTTINNINIEILYNNIIGLAGPTGCGKTTIADIIMGLLNPQKGEILVDDVKINSENIRSWQRLIGYVPQNIFLLDDTIEKNIAFGLKDEDIDREAVKSAAKIANIHEFIEKELPNGYLTVVGERGIRLSGGQRQRIGIARALYRDPPVLILDEATSSLDGITENAVMDAIHALNRKKTIIIIAHRLTTLKDCDMIYLILNGTIISKGSFEDLYKTNETFKNMLEGKT